MVLKKKISPPLASAYLKALVLSLVLAFSISYAEDFALEHNDEKIVVRFTQSWSFDTIKVPAYSSSLWGKGRQCVAATLQIADQHFVSARTGDGQYLAFNIPGLSSNSVIINPLLFKPASQSIDTALQFAAVPAQIRLIEDELNQRLDEVLAFQEQHNCFSCHTALPLALSCKTAAARGYRVNSQKIIKLGDSIARMQQENGAYNFPSHPDYGTITTTLCAGAILAMLSDFSIDYLGNLQKIFALLPGWLDKDGRTRSDFYFRPIFIGQPTSALFETFMVSTLYCRQSHDTELQDQLRQRLLRLGEWARKLTDEPVHRRIILMAGMPYLFQFNDQEKPEIIRQLLLLLNNEPEGKRPDIRSLALFLLGRIKPDQSIDQHKPLSLQNAGEKTWYGFEQIVSFCPTKAKKETQSADSSE